MSMNLRVEIKDTGEVELWLECDDRLPDKEAEPWLEKVSQMTYTLASMMRDYAQHPTVGIRSTGNRTEAIYDSKEESRD